MGKITGFNLIKYQSGGALEYYNCTTGMVGRAPSQKYKYKETNPLDPTDIWRIGKYYEDEFDCAAILSPEEYDDLVGFIDEGMADGYELRLEYTHGETDNDGYITKQFIISEVTEMPEIDDEGHEYYSRVEFKLKSVYYSLPALIGDVGIYAENTMYL